MLAERLERISADSIWAHRASGVRGSLIKFLDKLENGETVQEPKLEALISLGYEILQASAVQKR